MKIKTSKSWLAAGVVLGISILPALAQGTAGAGTPGSGGTTGHDGHNMAGGDMAAAPGAAQIDAAMRSAFDSLFMLKAVQSNLAEIATSQLALQKSRNNQTRQVAQHMIQQHTMANTELIQIMTRKGLPIPRTPGTMHMATQELLSRASRNTFDGLYLSAQMEAHENAITLFQQELAMGQDADARAYAAKYLPALQSHAAMVYSGARTVNAPGVAERPQLITTAGWSQQLPTTAANNTR